MIMVLAWRGSGYSGQLGVRDVDQVVVGLLVALVQVGLSLLALAYQVDALTALWRTHIDHPDWLVGRALIRHGRKVSTSLDLCDLKAAIVHTVQVFVYLLLIFEGVNVNLEFGFVSVFPLRQDID